MQPPSEQDEPFQFPVPDPAHFAFLKHIPPLQALYTWLEGDFKIGEEPALVHAVKTGLRLNLSDDDLQDLMMEFMELEIPPEEAVEILENLRDEAAGA